jgi:hypothetical protein
MNEKFIDGKEEKSEIQVGIKRRGKEKSSRDQMEKGTNCGKEKNTEWRYK